MMYRPLALTMALFSGFYFNKLHSETIPAIHKKISPVTEGFLYMGEGWSAAFGETQEEGCKQGQAYGFPITWEKPPMASEYSCYSTSSPGVRVEGTACIFCSDGNYRRDRCDYPMTCPDETWTLVPSSDGSESRCFRSDDYCWQDLDHVSEEQLIAAIVYGEASVDDDVNEMYAIASATMNMVRAHSKNTGYFAKFDNLFEFFKSRRYHDYSKALKHGNTRFRMVMCTENADGRLDKAYEAARNALSGGHDFSNGACWWDGYDLKTEGSRHYRYRSPQGFHFSSPEHNLFSIEEPPPYFKKYNGKIYNHVYESSAAYGKSIFWKYSNNYMKITGTPPCA